MKPGHLLFLLFICVVWGYTFVAGKAALQELPPLLFTALRYGLLIAVLFPLLKWHPGQMARVSLIVLTMGSFHFAAFYTGLALSSNVSVIAIVVQMSVPFATLLSILFLGETIGRWRLTGLALALAGIFLIGFDPVLFEDLDALAFVLLAALLGAIGTVAMRPVTNIRTFELQAWIAAASFPILLVCSALLETGQIESLAAATWRGWSGVLYTALGASLIGHAGMFYLLQRYEVSTVAPITLLAPVFGVVFGVLVWGDVLTTRLVLGGATVLAGILLVALREGRPTAPMTRPAA